jgi:hypothetical protein
VSSEAQITSSYVSASGNTSGTLFISGGGTLVAAIKMVGSYSAGDFNITSGNGGVVEITDPTVPNGGSVSTSATGTFRATASIYRTSPSARRRRLPIRRTPPAPAVR